MVKDLGYSENAYEKAKSKLEKKYEGERHLTALHGWREGYDSIRRKQSGSRAYWS